MMLVCLSTIRIGCGYNCHKNCMKNVPNNCGINERLMSEILNEIKRKDGVSWATHLTKLPQPKKIQKNKISTRENTYIGKQLNPVNK